MGMFDGVHSGHRIIIKRLIESAEELKGESVLITFSPHPRHVLLPNSSNLKMLNTLEEKTKLIESLGVDHLIIIPFTHEFSKTTSHDFITHYLVDKTHLKKLIIGQNHHFGHQRQGNFVDLVGLGNELGFKVEKTDLLQNNNAIVSSSKIRESLLRGDIKTPNQLLAYDYFISGTVVHGNQLGSTIGFPTANIQVNDEDKLIPAKGVYAVNVQLNNKQYQGMLNTGMRPTLNQHQLVTEVNIFNFDEDIYGSQITVRFKERIRDEKKFNDLESLKTQLNADKEEAVRLLKN